MTAPRILVFDSGLGGLSVLRELRIARPDAELCYLADTAGFPYGGLTEGQVIDRVINAMDAATARFAPDIAVIACNTASTLVLPHLRAAFDIAFVGTVPAIKPAANATTNRMISVLATPGTVKRDYTRALIDTYAFHIDVTLVGATRLAELAEAVLRGHPVDEAAIASEIAPAFVELGRRRTDAVVLGCTHYPLIREYLERLAPWPVTWIDPAPAIARRAVSLLPPADPVVTAGVGRAWFTGEERDGATGLGAVLKRFGVATRDVLPLEDARRGRLAQP